MYHYHCAHCRASIITATALEVCPRCGAAELQLDTAEVNDEVVDVNINPQILNILGMNESKNAKAAAPNKSKNSLSEGVQELTTAMDALARVIGSFNSKLAEQHVPMVLRYILCKALFKRLVEGE